MLRFLVSRMVQALLVMVAVGAIAFALFRYVGDPVAMMVSAEDSPEMRDQLRLALGLDRPAIEQFVSYLGKIAQGDSASLTGRASPSRA